MDRGSCTPGSPGLAASLTAFLPALARTDHRGPNVILARFGGGVRRAASCP